MTQFGFIVVRIVSGFIVVWIASELSSVYTVYKIYYNSCIMQKYNHVLQVLPTTSLVYIVFL